MSRTIRRKQFKSFRNPKHIGQRRAVDMDGVDLCRNRNRIKTTHMRTIDNWDDFYTSAQIEDWRIKSDLGKPIPARRY